MSRNPKSLAPLSQVDTAAFKAWFRDSKVVGLDRQPLMVYHGTRRSFDSFDSSASVANPWLLGNDNKHGFFFTANAGGKSDSGPWNGAAGFAGTSQREGETVALDGANVMPVYLALQCPYRMTQAEYRKSGSRENLRDELEALGYDGIVIGDQSENNLEMVAFRPEQIKSVFNRGDFDPASPNIAMSRVERERAR